jgi:hypothetical protein
MMLSVDIRTLLLNVRVASCANWKWNTANYASDGASTVAGVDAVGLTVAALPTHVGAKLQRVVGWICLHERKRHRR